MKNMAYVGVGIMVIIVIIVVASMAIANNENASAEQGSSQQFSCDNLPRAPEMWKRAGDDVIVNPAYNKWYEEWGHCLDERVKIARL